MSPANDKKKCPYCSEMIQKDAIKCRYCGSWLDRKHYLESWKRTREKRMLLGICAGLAKQFDINVTLIRLAFILAFILGGWGLIVYLVLWILMPLED